MTPFTHQSALFYCRIHAQRWGYWWKASHMQTKLLVVSLGGQCRVCCQFEACSYRSTVFYNVVTFRFHWLRVNFIFLHHIKILYIDSKIYVNELSVFLYGAVKLFIQEIWSLIRSVWICICTYDELKAVILAIVVWPGIMFQINVRM